MNRIDLFIIFAYLISKIEISKRFTFAFRLIMDGKKRFGYQMLFKQRLLFDLMLIVC